MVVALAVMAKRVATAESAAQSMDQAQFAPAVSDDALLQLYKRRDDGGRLALIRGLLDLGGDKNNRLATVMFRTQPDEGWHELIVARMVNVIKDVTASNQHHGVTLLTTWSGTHWGEYRHSAEAIIMTMRALLDDRDVVVQGLVAKALLNLPVEARNEYAVKLSLRLAQDPQAAHIDRLALLTNDEAGKALSLRPEVAAQTVAAILRKEQLRG